MSYNLKRSLKRAKRYLKIVKRFLSQRNKFFNKKLGDIDWLKANSIKMQNEMNLLGFAIEPYTVSEKWRKKWGEEKINSYVSIFPYILELYRLIGVHYGMEQTEQMRDDLLKFIQDVKERIEDHIVDKEISASKKKEIDDIKITLQSTNIKDYIKNDKEFKVLYNNMNSSIEFDKINNYKYSIIAMGSVLEILIQKYCIKNGISPEPFNGRRGNAFANFLEAAIKNNIFGESKRWQIVQDCFRAFRNYVDIGKEIKSVEIDHNWHKTMKLIYNALIELFKTMPSKK